MSVRHIGGTPAHGTRGDLVYDGVQAVFFAFQSQFEGRVEYMYQDVLGKVTIGIGNLIDPVSLALQLPFVSKNDESPAGPDDIRRDFDTVKGDPSLAARGHEACRDITRLKLTDPAIDGLVQDKAAGNESRLRARAEFAGYDDWPADAQLGLESMAWAMGPVFRFPHFHDACADGRWVTAAQECHMDDHLGGTLVHRNAANRALFRNAAYVQAEGLDPAVLQYTVMGVLRKALKAGDDTADVVTLQDRLAALDYLGEPTGSFDDATDAAVRTFQLEFGLADDGVVGGGTWAALGTCVPAGTEFPDS
jgi:GH24 family phage-related lysozyme (muramidase)